MSFFFFFVPIDIMYMYLLLRCFFIIKNCGKLSKMGIYRNELFFFFFGSQKVVPKRRKTHYLCVRAKNCLIVLKS